MRTIPTFAGIALTLVAAGAVMAASPAPTPAPAATPAPAKAAAPAKTPAAATSTAATSTAATSTAASSAATTLSAAIRPLNVTTGTTTVTQAADGSGTITVTLHGLVPDAAWSVDIDSGTSLRFNDLNRVDIATRNGTGVEKVSSDTFRIHLTASEMKRFNSERSKNGVTVLVSDGTNRSAAVFAAG
jgi:hypothetical protein